MGRPAEAAAPGGGDVELGTPDAPAAEPRRLRPGYFYRNVTGFDLVVLIIGFTAAVLHGAMFPLFAIAMAEGIHVTATAVQVDVGTAIGGVVENIGIICAATLICATVWTSAFFWFAGRQTARLRFEYFKCVLTRDLGWFDQNQPAALPARMVTEMKAVHEAIGTHTGEIVVYTSQFVVALLTAFIRGWELTLVICAAIPVIVGVGHVTAIKVKVAKQAEDAWLAQAGAVTEESVLAIRTVSAFGGELREVERLKAQLQGAKWNGIKASVATGFSYGLLNLCLCCSFALAFWYGSHHMIAQRGRSQTDVIVVIVVMVIGVSSLSGLQGPMDILMKAMVAASSVCAVLDLPSQIEPSKDTIKDPPMQVSVVETISFRDVHFSYPSRPEVPILDGLSLSISRSQKVALVGASGSGKSTVVQLLERFYDPISGGIFINDVGLPQLPIYSWRRLIGYVGQEPVLFQFSVLENIKGGDPALSDDAAFEAAKQAEAFDFVSALPSGFQTLVGVGGSQMSGGQKQRIAIARSLARRPQILILDEATSALDNASEKLVQATLDQLQSSACTSLTTISIAHRLSTVQNSDVIFVLKHGKVVEQGSHSDLVAAHGEYHSLVQAQRSVQAEDGDGEEREGAAGAADDAGGAARASSPPLGSGAPPHGPPLVPRIITGLSRATQASGLSRTSHKPNEPTGLAVSDGPCMRRLVGLTRPEWALYPLGLLASLLSGAHLPLQGLLLNRGFESLYEQPASRMLAQTDTWGLSLVVLGLVIVVSEAGKHGFFGYMQQCLTIRLRVQAFSSMMRQEMGYYDDPSVHIQSLGSALARAAQEVSMMMGIGIGNTVQALFSVAAGLGFAFFGSVKLTLVMLAVMPLVAVSTIIVAKVLTDPFDSEANSAADSVAATAVLNIRTVRALGAEAKFTTLLERPLFQLAGIESRSALKKGLAIAFNAMVFYLVYLVGIWYGAQLVSEGTDPTHVYQALICVTLGCSSAGLAASYGPILQIGRRSACGLFSLIDRSPKIDDEVPAGKHQDLGDGTLEFCAVTFRFPHRAEQRVLKQLSFKVEKGQTVALVGPSGSGKSTVVQLLLRYYDPTEGGIKVGNVDLRSFDLCWWRRQVGLVGQEPVLFDVSLEDNIKYGCPEATRADVEAAAREANMDYALSGAIAWEERLGLRGERLSGGQKQRCAIARAIVRRPAVLLLDEATSALDSASEQVVQAALDNVRRGRTTLTIAHRLSTIKDSNMILVISAGRIVEYGTHDELLANHGWYAHMAPQ